MTARKITVLAVALVCITAVSVSAVMLFRGDDGLLKKGRDRAEYTIENSVDVLAGLEDSRWKKLNLEERLGLARLIKNIEVCYLGIPHGIAVEMGDAGGAPAKYNDSDKRILIDADYLSRATGKEMLSVMCHETYHAYQYRLCDAYDSVGGEYKNLLIFANVDDYRYEMEHYIDVSEDEEAYRGQKLEKNADSYAEDAVGDYFRKINLFLHKEESDGE